MQQRQVECKNKLWQDCFKENILCDAQMVAQSPLLHTLLSAPLKSKSNNSYLSA